MKSAVALILIVLSVAGGHRMAISLTAKKPPVKVYIKPGPPKHRPRLPTVPGEARTRAIMERTNLT